ncbi:hypothetical protein M3Y94_01252600 [Aphelenchoides besseyi]|nr:hypothetical protein M3Y94_01252600 [Aphelenchoides besseyi]KAI6219426.1 hypothetical protein M3Y95_01109900 [Aphelenchoides besseyi]
MKSCTATALLLLLTVHLVSSAGHPKKHARKPPVHHKPAVHHKPVVHHKPPVHHKPATRHKSTSNQQPSHPKPTHHKTAPKPQNQPKQNYDHLTRSLRPISPETLRVKAIRAGTICGDYALNCHVVDHICTERSYANVLTEMCALRCGFCAPRPSECVDRHPSNCKKWAREGLCTSTYFSKQFIRSNCAKTCSMCSGKTNCNLSTNRFLDECLSRTCMDSNLQTTNPHCVVWCRNNPNKCQKSQPTNCNDFAERYKSECLSQTCADSSEKNSVQCQKWCLSNPNNQACVQMFTPPCDQPQHKYSGSCYAHTCRKQWEKTSEQCRKWCDDDVNAEDGACVGVEPLPSACDGATKYSESCLSRTCRKASEKKSTECKLFCDLDPRQAACASVEPGPIVACDVQANEELPRCLPRTCRKPGKRSLQACEQYCENNADDPHCFLVEPIVNPPCDGPPPLFTAACAPITCRANTNKNNVGCQNWCSANPDGPECFGVQPPLSAFCDTDVHRFTTNCIDATCRLTTYKNNPNLINCKAFCDKQPEHASCDDIEPLPNPLCDTSSSKYSSDCLSVTCRRTAERTSPECRMYCDTFTDDPACRRIAPMDDKDCDATANKYAVDCLYRTCRFLDQKTRPECIQHCELLPDNPECRDVEPEANVYCDSNDNKYKSQCLEHTCRQKQEKDKNECEAYCQSYPHSAACIY